MPLDEVRRARRGSARLRRARRVHRPDAVGAVGRAAAPRRHRARDGGQAAILLYDEATTGLDPITATTVDDEIIKLRDLEDVSSIVVTHQLRDAFFVATHEAVARRAATIEIVQADAAKCDEAEFIMLKDGLIVFEGNAAELRARQIRTFATFCHRGLTSMPRTRSLAWAELKIGLVVAVRPRDGRRAASSCSAARAASSGSATAQDRLREHCGAQAGCAGPCRRRRGGVGEDARLHSAATTSR